VPGLAPLPDTVEQWPSPWITIDYAQQKKNDTAAHVNTLQGRCPLYTVTDSGITDAVSGSKVAVLGPAAGNAPELITTADAWPSSVGI
jgi:hypothetical protein